MKFLRRTWNRYSKLGRKRKKKQVWRKPTGRDNKMREKRKGYPAVVSIGYKKGKNECKKIVKINTQKDLNKIQKDEIVILGKMGQKKKIEIAKKAKEKKIEISNLNVEKFLKNLEKKAQKKVEEEKKSETKETQKSKKGGKSAEPKGSEDKGRIHEKETDKQSSKNKELNNKKISEPSGEANVSEPKASDGGKK